MVVDLGRRWPPWSAGCARGSAAGSRSRGRCRRPRRPPASPSARGTAGRRRRGSRRSAAAPPRRGCRRPGCSCPEPDTPVTTTSRRVGIVTSIPFRLWTRTPRRTMSEGMRTGHRSTPGRAAPGAAAPGRCSCAAGECGLRSGRARPSRPPRRRGAARARAPRRSVRGSRSSISARGTSSSAFRTCGSQATVRRRASPSPKTCIRTCSSSRRAISSRFCSKSSSGEPQLA